MTYRAQRLRRNDDHGVDDWLMTYADMITLLLCFFAVFLSVSVPKKEIFKQAREKVLEKFAAPYMLEGRFPDRPGEIQTGGQYNSLPSIVDRYPGIEGDDLQTKKDAKEAETDKNKDEEKKKEKDGDRITTLEMPSAAFFTSGSASLSDAGKTLLKDLLENQLNAATLQGYQITVEGHTDDVPINTLQFPSNWELSTARAAAVVRFFIEQSIPAQRMRVAGYADSQPKAPNRDEAGKPLPENQAQNRRVVIKLEKIEKQE